MMSVGLTVGRLAEVRFRQPITVDELSGFMSSIRRIVDGATQPIVFCTDWRKLLTFTPEVFDTIVWIMRRDNPRIECNAVLVTAGNREFEKQLTEMLRQARSSTRRLFTEESSLVGWLEPRLRPDERVRLSVFLLEGR